MPGSNGSAEAEEGGTGSDDESGMRGSSSPRWSRKTEGTKGWRLRGVEWRVKLGILPGGSATVDEMRRASADGRRRYADLRRRLLVDPHIMDDQKSAHLNMDNPLSLDPESVWGRYFRNAELEKTIEKDLTRLYPEHGVFFQSTPCQAMMRRILLVWSLIHPQFSYRQGMHELLAPLLYVLHVDVVRLSQVKHRFEDLFDDRFDSLSLQEQHVRDKVESAKTFCGEMVISGDSINFEESPRSKGAASDPEEQRVDLSVIVQGSDMYGVEGELGALLSARFLEHDAYCMLDALLYGQDAAVSMAEYFTSSTGGGKPPVIEASAALFRTLAAADISLYAHLVELGVEPQFFALRWLRLLFGREFVLDDLLRVWDAIFAADNSPLYRNEGEQSSQMKISQRSALISAISVSMLLYVRPALLAAPDITACLQRLLNFPQIPDVRDLIESAKSLQLLAQAACKAPGPPVPRSARSSEIRGSGKHVRSGSISPPTPQHLVLRHQSAISSTSDVLRVSMSLPGSYWEEKWTHSVLQKKTPEELFSPRTRTDVVSRGFDHSILEREGSSVPSTLTRSTSEGRHQNVQTVRLDPIVSKLSVKISEFSQDSSDDDGQEMLRRCGETANKHPALRNTGGFPESTDIGGKEWRDNPRLSPEEDGSVVSASFSPLQQDDPSSDRSSDETSSLSSLQPNTSKASPADCGVDSHHPAAGLCFKDGDDADESINTLGGCAASESVISGFGNKRDPVLEESSIVQPLLGPSESSLESSIGETPSVTFSAPVSTSLETLGKFSTAIVSRGDSAINAVGSLIPTDRNGHNPGRSNGPPTETCGSNESPEVETGSQDDRANGDSLHCRTSSESPASENNAAERHKEGDNSTDDSPVSGETPFLPSKSKPPLPPSRLGRFNWMWSLGRSSFGEKAVANKVSKEEATGSEVAPSSSSSVTETDMSGSTAGNGALRRKKSWWRANSDVVPEDCVATTSTDSCSQVDSVAVLGQAEPQKDVNVPADLTSEVKPKEDVLAEVLPEPPEVAKKPKELTPSAALEALGQSVLEHVQVLESVLAQKVSVLGIENMMWSPVVREKSEGANRPGLGSKGQTAAIGAIAELRKISQALQQM